MKLEGSLDAFSLPDVFQLLSFTRKTGGLHLASDGSDGVVFFTTGQVTGASADGSRQPLARRLVGSGAVTDDSLSAAIAAVNEGEGLGVVRALLESQAVDADFLRKAATDQLVDAVFDLLRWTAGDFAFVMGEGNPDDVGVSLGIETVLGDAEARRSTWETVSQVVPSSKAVPMMPVVLEADPVVSREEWSLLALVDGRRSVGELVDLTGGGQYAVVSTVAALVQRGLLEVRAEDGSDDEREDHVTVVVRRQHLLAGLEEFEPVRAAAEAPQPVMLGGAHVPENVVPPRPEPFLPKRQADFDETATSPGVRPVSVQTPTPGAPTSGAGSSGGRSFGDVVGATATAPDQDSSLIERDPNVNRSLMLRLIAGVRGL